MKEVNEIIEEWKDTKPDELQHLLNLGLRLAGPKETNP